MNHRAKDLIEAEVSTNPNWLDLARAHYDGNRLFPVTRWEHVPKSARKDVNDKRPLIQRFYAVLGSDTEDPIYFYVKSRSADIYNVVINGRKNDRKKFNQSQFVDWIAQRRLYIVAKRK